eukprot:CAMPEP_0168464618 /NCGR_PEP_ID=MMETSP0228-20121227/55674_1 /TAXON_ID=133427 /ORGANISM="Protoceratium reticulatum, Strain CCCM 535 (=CCMP 1889)" /LENGTH=44 /DNA_ID= /DNA_START= /DNA_END= /DNA_ORIENTATION=
MIPGHGFADERQRPGPASPDVDRAPVSLAIRPLAVTRPPAAEAS